MFKIETAQQVSRRLQPVSAARAHVGQRLEILRKLCNRGVDARFAPNRANQGALGRRGAGGHRRHATERDPRNHNATVLHLHGECDGNGGDVLIEALRHLVACDPTLRLGSRHFHGHNEFARLQGRPLIAEVKPLQRQRAYRRATPQYQLRIQGNQDRQ